MIRRKGRLFEHGSQTEGYFHWKQKLISLRTWICDPSTLWVHSTLSHSPLSCSRLYWYYSNSHRVPEIHKLFYSERARCQDNSDSSQERAIGSTYSLRSCSIEKLACVFKINHLQRVMLIRGHLPMSRATEVAATGSEDFLQSREKTNQIDSREPRSRVYLLQPQTQKYEARSWKLFGHFGTLKSWEFWD